ncbi:MAG: hypothetical protein U9R79_07465 [Armatimonadota bacterium]|nr:hypothetical protein [Armatimonadota bacterium]
MCTREAPRGRAQSSTTLRAGTGVNGSGPSQRGEYRAEIIDVRGADTRAAWTLECNDRIGENSEAIPTARSIWVFDHFTGHLSETPVDCLVELGWSICQTSQFLTSSGEELGDAALRWIRPPTSPRRLVGTPVPPVNILGPRAFDTLGKAFYTLKQIAHEPIIDPHLQVPEEPGIVFIRRAVSPETRDQLHGSLLFSQVRVM